MISDNTLFGIPDLELYCVLSILAFFLILEVIGGYWHRSQRTSEDWLQELGGYLALALVIKPGIVIFVLIFGDAFLPSLQYVLFDYGIWLGLLFYIFIDDLLQYWYHRSAHEYQFLWKLHRAHHQAEEMGFFVSYRNAALYYIIMPNLWWVGICTFLGFGQSVALGLILKQLIVISAHSTLPYDKFLYRYKFLTPIITVLERIFITPAFHHAHHGKTKLDGISDPNGNFGNMFSIWDQVFGTARFVHEFPTEYGLENNPKEPWTVSYLYPLVKAKDTNSEMSANYKKEDTTSLEAALVELEKGKKYLWCQCGMSKNQPFCDSSHHGTKIKPVLFEAKRTGTVKLCNCKQSKTNPFCDNSHIAIKEKQQSKK